MDQKFEAIIGLEIHIELQTQQKMFCACRNESLTPDPNTNVCPICLALPGAMPVPNQKAIDWTIMLAKALNCKINKKFIFDRKHYLYPDLPKGYQITQYEFPIGYDGNLEIKCADQQDRTFAIRRVHLEEDTAKLVHLDDSSLIDFNRCGVPLVEIVSEPVFHTAEDVKTFLEELQVIIRYLGISTADMEKGNMRLEPNISVRSIGTADLPDYKVELKNINSFKFVKDAINFEINRQIDCIQKGDKIVQETRGYNVSKKCTFTQRIKETAQDYRYFPEPDIPPFELSDEELETIQKQLPELPFAKCQRFVDDFKLNQNSAFSLTREVNLTKRFEEIVDFCTKSEVAKLPDLNQKIANVILNKQISPDVEFADFVQKLSELFEEKQTDMSQLAKTIDEAIAENVKAVTDYQSGKESAVMYLVGAVMRKMAGKADANIAKEEIIKKLKSK